MVSQGKEGTGINRYAIDTHRALSDISDLYFLKFRSTQGIYSIGKIMEGRFPYGSSAFNMNSVFPKLAFGDFISHLNYMKKEGNLVHVMSPHVLPILTDSNNIVTIHDFSPFLDSLGSSIELRLTKHFYRNYINFKYIITVSKYVAQKAKEFGAAGKVRVIYPYVKDTFHHIGNKEELRRKYSLPQDKTLLLSISTDIPRKNIRVLPTVVNFLGGNFRLVRIGPKLPNSICLYPKDDESLNEIYNACDLLVSTSLDEGFGYPVAEAMRAELPVAISDIPAHREIAEKNGHFFNPTDPNDIAKVIKEAVYAASQPDELSRTILDKFSVKRFRRSMLEFYQEVSKNDSVTDLL